MSLTSVEFIPGPPISQLSREAAAKAISNHPLVKAGASYALEQHQGHWAAVIVQAGPFPPAAPGDKDTGDEAGPPSPDEAPPTDDGGDDGSESPDGPPKDKGDDKKGDKGGNAEIMQALQQIADALGIPLGLGDSPVPGADMPPGPPGPPPPPGGPGAGPDTKVHERALKPGETPPGGTPVGAPAFASVRNDHPWAHIAGKVGTFKVAETVEDDASFEQALTELTSLAKEIGYNAKAREARDEQGNRVIEGLISVHK